MTLPPPTERRHRAIVLVHGAWVGEWSWSPVLPLLEASGRVVFAVSLTGHGVRRHESGPHITLEHHVADVTAVFDVHDLSDVTLVGHSYGGRVITAAYDPDPEVFGGDEGVAWFRERLVPQSFATFTAPLDGRLPTELPKTYVYATAYSPSRFAGYAAAARDDPAWEYVELNSDHWLMFSHPDDVAAIILR